MNIVIANAAAVMDNGTQVISFPSRWDSGVPIALFNWYPYELAYLSSLLKRELPQATVTLLDGQLEGWDGDRYIKEIAALQPDVLVCELSALTYPTMTRVMQTVDSHRYGGLQSILCGPMGSYAVDRALGDDWNVVITGEYEIEVLQYLTGKPAPPEARTDAGLINLDWLPWPDDSMGRDRYYEINHYAPPAMIQMYPTRGCPLSCTFCVVPSYYGGHGKTSRSHRCRDVGNVCDEIEYLAAKYPDFKGCYFNEEAHSANPEWLASLCEELIRRGLNKYQYDAMCGMWSFDRALVELCARAGYKQIRFGVESTSELVGKAIKKTIHKEKIETFLGWCKEFGVGAYGTFQIGAMGSTKEIDQATMADLRGWIKAGLMQKWQISTSTPQPGTPFYELCKREGWLMTEDINLYDGKNAVVSYPNYSAEQIAEVRENALSGRIAEARKERNLKYLAATREFYEDLFKELEQFIEQDALDNFEMKRLAIAREATGDEQGGTTYVYGGYEQVTLHIVMRGP